MTAILFALVPGWVKWALGGCAVAGLGLLKARASGSQAGAEKAKTQIAQAIVVNHAVEQKEQAAVTDQEADDALDADAAADHRE